ncbi:MAG: ribonuclease Y [Deltaproteobacteria bacterium]|nr:ribonuclease Y [Deltaproteobacteria bacterium]
MLITCIGLGLGSLVIGYLLSSFLNKKIARTKINQLEQRAKTILEEAKIQADHIKKESALHAKNNLLELRAGFEKETKERREELVMLEKRILQKEEYLEKKEDILNKRDFEVGKKERNIGNTEQSLQKREEEYKRKIEDINRELQRISELSFEDAKQLLIESTKEKAKHDIAKMLKQLEDEAKQTAEDKAREIIAVAIQRYSGEYAQDIMVTKLSIPSDEIKGRIIGREGRNIRAIEAATGVDIVIDDTPQSITISGHDPVKREIARLSLEKLISDGRIHPGRIEEIANKTSQTVEKSMKDAGDRAVFDLGLHGIHTELIKLVGRLKYRTSYAQNVYQHSIEVAFIVGIMAAELGLNIKQAKRAGLLHDIGKAVDHEVEGSHAVIGGNLARKYGEAPLFVEAIEQHHNDNPVSILGILVQAADALSAARPGARREMYEAYVKRLDDLERLSKSFDGIEKAYAIQAGREIRVIVAADKVSDDDITIMSKQIADRIEKEMSYPGTIKVTVIRETRSSVFAK